MRRIADPRRTGRFVRVLPFDTWGRGGALIKRWRWEVSRMDGSTPDRTDVFAKGDEKSERKARKAAQRVAVTDYRRECEAKRSPRPEWEEAWDEGVR